jgi:DNA-binding XRE family transcriptional regulator
MNVIQHLESALPGIPNRRLRRDIRRVICQVRWPMADILAHVAGKTIAERAKMIGVSRQTYYQWLWEEVRPYGAEAQRLAELSGVPLAIISARAEEGDLGPGEEIDPAAAGLAQDGDRLPGRAGRVSRGRARALVKQDQRRHARKMRRRIGGGPQSHDAS